MTNRVWNVEAAARPIAERIQRDLWSKKGGDLAEVSEVNAAITEAVEQGFETALKEFEDFLVAFYRLPTAPDYPEKYKPECLS